jgi:hypothetical protein
MKTTFFRKNARSELKSARLQKGRTVEDFQKCRSQRTTRLAKVKKGIAKRHTSQGKKRHLAFSFFIAEENKKTETVGKKLGDMFQKLGEIGRLCL